MSGLRRADLPSDPMVLAIAWYREATTSDLLEPTAGALATATAAGRPSVRMVLVKEFRAEGPVFFTNHRSRKGRELESNPQGAVTLWWDRLERQLRVEGEVEKLSPDDSDRYFSSRPRGSRLGAHASPQSRPIASRTELVERVHEVTERFEGVDVPRPADWGGFLLRPSAIEFWQGRESRLHDRFRYRRLDGDSWQIDRLAP